MDETESKAISMGWVPEDKFRGDPKNFVDAETFVKRGEEFLPIIKAENRRLEAQNRALGTQVSQQSTAITELRDSVEALKDYNSQMTRDNAKTRRAQLKTKLVQARKDEDVDAELEIEEQIEQADEVIKAADKEAKLAPAEKPVQGDNNQQAMNTTPEFVAWKSENTWWLGDSEEDQLKTNVAVGVGQGIVAKLKREGKSPSQKEFLEMLDKELDKVFKNESRGGSQKVDGGSQESDGKKGGGGSNGKKSFSSLPQEIKETCDRMGERLIGPGKSYKDLTSWRAKYVADYYAE